MRRCEDILATMAETRKGMEDCITILDRIIAAQAASEADMRAKGYGSRPRYLCAASPTRTILVSRLNPLCEAPD